jgi:hypothetical protein
MGIKGWIERFNSNSFEGFDGPSNPDGSPSSLSNKEILGIIRIAFVRPIDLGFP